MFKLYSKLLNCSPTKTYRTITSTIVALHRTEQNNRYTGSNIQEDLISNALRDGIVPSTKDWISIKKEVLANGRAISDVNFDAVAIGFCITHRNYNAAKSFMKLIKEQNKKLNVGALGKFMRLYYVCNEELDSVNEDEENLILSMYYDLKKEYPIFASTTGENIIHALSITKEWKECLTLLKDMKISGHTSASTTSAVIKAAFHNREYDLGWKILNEMISEERLPTPVVYEAWLKLEQKNPENVQKLLQFFGNHDIHPTTQVTDTLMAILPQSTGAYTTMSNRGICQQCKKELQRIKLDLNEFEHLKSVFMTNVIVGKNLFNKTTPGELNKFKAFVEKVGKVDVVVDGLNIAYSAGANRNPHVYGKLLANVVGHFRQQSKRILVLGRVHMNKWPKQYMNYVRSNSEVFLAENLSQDDPFLLYATMSSGLGTHFLSRDFMRGHSYLLMDTNLRRIFRRWQQSHQYSLIYVEDNGKVHLKAPFPILPTAQEDKNGWHIPYIRQHIANPPIILEPPKHWLCIRNK